MSAKPTSSAQNTHWGKVSIALCAGLFVSMQVGKLGPAIPVLRDDLGLSLVDAGYALSIFTLLAIFLAVPLGAFSTFFGRRSIIVLGQTDGPAKTLKIEGTNTSIGTISAVSNNFCSSCNRVRLTAKGELILCLGQKDSVSLRDAIRSGMKDQEVKQLILNAITKKPEKHFFDSVVDNISNRQMVEMGG